MSDKPARFVVLMVMSLASVVGLGRSASPADNRARELIEQGRAIVDLNCARCHAVGKSGQSPFPNAPPFRALSDKYPIEHLAEALAEGIMSGHPAT